ncbi:MAG TPA: LytTR family DNA-binding domain-containing protein, partial [Pelobium sp.]|nr:LytTR family DNA-binding domain-containing protein [Pelobium sp.]
NCPVILTAKSKEHALKAFQLNTVAYLLKPLTQKKLLEALNKFFVLKNIFTEIGTKHFKDRFFVSIGNKMLFFILDEIAFFLSEDKAVFLYTTDGRRFILDYTLNSLQSQLDNHLFFRINRNVLAKINAISCIKKHGNRQLLLTLASGERTHNFVVSRNKVQEFKKWIGK